MKATIKEIEDKVFKPFTLEIEINTLEEARELWHRFNVYCLNTPPEADESHPYHRYDVDELWETIDNRLKPFEERNN